MAFEKPKIPTVPTGLAFQASDALNESLYAFVRPDLREAARAEGKRFTLLSEQVAQLGLYARARVDKDVVAIDKYETAVGTIRHTDINLQPFVEVDDSDRRFIYLRFALFLQANKALNVLVRPPLFPSAEGNVTIFKRIPRQRLASGVEVQAAERDLHIRMVATVADVAMAPWTMSVKGVTVVKEWDNPNNPGAGHSAA